MSQIIAVEGTPWPNDVRGTDWTSPAMAAPPAERTRIGYHRWSTLVEDEVGEQEQVSCGVDYYVLPDGSAEAVRFDDDGTETARYEPGTWEVDYPTWCHFGSRGGCFIRPKQ